MLFRSISQSLFETYEILLSKGEIFYPLTDLHKRAIDSTVKTVEASYYGHVRFPTFESKAAAYFVFLIKDHDVFDGNKRLAVLWLKTYTSRHELKLNLPSDTSLAELAVGVETYKEDLDALVQVITLVLFHGEAFQLR